MRCRALLLAIAVAACGCGGGEPDVPRRRFAVIPKATDIPVFAYAKIGAERKARELGDVEVIWRGTASADAEAQRALLDELSLVRDARVSPLLAAIAMRWREGRLAEAAVRAMDMLGMLGSSVTRDAIDALSRLIEATRWWSPRRARMVRERAAAALAAAGTPEAWAALEEAANRRGRGAPHARQALARKPA